MTLTTPRGFSGGPMSDIDYGIGAAGGAWVESAAALAVTQPNTGTRTVSIAPGTACAYGIRVSNDAALTQALAAPGSGGAWYLLALRFVWTGTGKGVTLQVLPGSTTGGTATPTDVPAALPGTMSSSPGSTFDLPLAWVWASSATTTLTLFDVRMRMQLNEPVASTPQALTVLAQQVPMVRGLLVPSLSDSITYRWNGTAWKPWDSEWATYQVTTTGFTVSNFTNGAQWRYVSGEVEVTCNWILNSGMSSGGNPDYGSITVPVPAAYLSYDDLLQFVKYNRSGDADFLGVLDWRDANRLWIATPIVVTRNSTQVVQRTAVSGTVPFSWASGDGIHGRFRYRPA